MLELASIICSGTPNKLHKSVEVLEREAFNPNSDGENEILSYSIPSSKITNLPAFFEP